MKTKLLSMIALLVSFRVLACGGYGMGYTAHEWGTFTSVQGADGVQLEWNPFVATDLPGFVYRRDTAGIQFGLTDIFTKEMTPSIVRMETPVIYFYSLLPRTVDVRVEFAEGKITEWYPQATALGSVKPVTAGALAGRKNFIEWKEVNVLGAKTTEITANKLIREPKESHYYPARETDANFLRMNAPKARSGAEYDNLLFYRGVGSFRAPLQVTVSSDESTMQLSTTNTEAISDLFVLTIQRGSARFQRAESVSASRPATVRIEAARFQTLSDARSSLMREMKDALVKQGLFEREAQAMVQTWQDQWFSDEGTRVLYLLPRSWTDQRLPMQLTPAPQSLVRVMVGRSEVIMPSTIQSLTKSIERYQQGHEFAKITAIAEAKELQLGRFVEPAVRYVVRTQTNKQSIDAAWKFAHDLNQALQPKPAVVKMPGSETKTAQIPDGRAVAAVSR